MLTPEERAAIQKREQAATTGPWGWRNVLVPYRDEPTALISEGNSGSAIISLNDRYDGWPVWGKDLRMEIAEPDRDFIAHSREDVHALLAHIDAQAAEIARLKQSAGADTTIGELLAQCRETIAKQAQALATADRTIARLRQTLAGLAEQAERLFTCEDGCGADLSLAQAVLDAEGKEE